MAITLTNFSLTPITKDKDSVALLHAALARIPDRATLHIFAQN
jgi:hypothetical protein